MTSAPRSQSVKAEGEGKRDMRPDEWLLARHALGLPNRYRKSYRNRYLAGGPLDIESWEGMVSAGFAETTGARTVEGMQWFWLTEAGAKAALRRSEKLCPEDFPTAARSARTANQKGS
jgi:hypothetical protein